MAVVFGCVTDTGTYGICQSITRGTTAEHVERTDAGGRVDAYHSYNYAETIALEYIYDSSKTIPRAGNTMTIAGVKWLIESSEVVESNVDFKRANITGIRWVTNTIPK